MGAFWSLLGILSGAFIAIQAPINSQLARGLGLPVAAAAFSFLSGAIVLGVIAFAVVRLQDISLDWKAPRPVELFCKTCGTSYPAGTRFCGRCGKLI